MMIKKLVRVAYWDVWFVLCHSYRHANIMTFKVLILFMTVEDFYVTNRFMLQTLIDFVFGNCFIVLVYFLSTYCCCL